MSQQFGPPKNPTDNKKLQIQGDKWVQDDWKRPSGLLRVLNNNVRLTVYPNHPQDPDAKPMNVNMDIKLGGILLALIKQAVNDPNFTEKGIENVNFSYPGGQRSEKPEVQTKVWVMRNQNGEIALKVAERNRKYQPILKFAPDTWFNLIRGDGSALDAGEMSQLIALGWVDAVSSIIPAVYVKDYVHNDGKKDGKKGGGNGRSQSRGNGGFGDSGGGGDVFAESDGF